VREDAGYDGVTGSELKTRLGLPRIDIYDSIPSTMDAAHAAAEAGASAGTLIVAERQTAGRGRGGRRWASAARAGVWLTLIERPGDPKALDVLSLRLGLRLAPVLDLFTDLGPVDIKWPNDLYVAGGKLAGILTEARWQDERPAWVAIGLGINVVAPVEIPGAAGLRSGVGRAELLLAVVPALRHAARQRGALTEDELEAYAGRDMARGQPCREPAVGTVAGISPSGELLVRCSGAVGAFRSGSLVMWAEP
jgi:BirA family transcriptional regulator, biotin operon repressor / biotin---[acetyl-CoA-carboxylase] ligase